MLGRFFSKISPAKSLSKNVIGLDFDDKSVKLIELNKKNPQNISIVNFCVKDVPQTPAEDRSHLIASTIRKCLDENSIQGDEVFASVSGPGVSIRRITVPVMPEDELYGAVKWEAKNLIPFPLEAVTLNYYVIGKVTEKETEKLDVIVVAAQDSVINSQIKIIEAAGLKASGITATPFALWDILKRNTSVKPEEVTALIDIGAETASINLFKNNILQFTREISVAGDSITKAMTGVLISDQWQLSLTYEQAEKIKLDYGIPPENSTEKTSEGIPLSQIREVMRPTLRRMLNEILRSFDYYKEQFREERINKVFIGGGSSRIKNLEEYLTSGLGVKVELLNPLEGLDISAVSAKPAAGLKEASPRLTLALGLAIGETKSLNLIHVKKAVQKPFAGVGAGLEFEKMFGAVHVPTVAWMTTLALLVVAALAYNIYLGRKVSYYRMELNSKRAILSDLKTLSERREIAAKIAREESRLRETLSLFDSTIPPGVTLTRLAYDNPTRKMSVSGVTNSISLVGKMLTNIDHSPDFSGATLIESKKGLGDASGSMAFDMTFKVD